ncbi:MAG: diguanylate cyclase [Candidatus Limnocylindria bacterium]
MAETAQAGTGSASPVRFARRRLSTTAARRVLRDPHVGHALLLALAVVILASVREHALPLLAGTMAIFIALQGAIALALPRVDRHRRSPWSIVRFLVGIAFVAAMQVMLGATGILAVAYLPIVAMAASYGRRATIVVTGSAIAIHSLNEVVDRAPDGDGAQRAAAFALFAILVALATRLEVTRLQLARRRLRQAVTADRRRARQIAGVEAIGRILASGGPTREALDGIVAQIDREFGYHYVSIYLGSETEVSLGAQRGYSELVEGFDGQHGIVGRVMRTRRPAFVPDVSADPDYWGVNSDVRSEICVPLLAQGEFLGFINVESTASAPLDATDLRVMVAVADRLAAALITGRDRLALAERVELFRHLHEFSEAINGTLEPNELYAAIVERVASVVPAEIAALVILERASGRYFLRAITPTEAAEPGIEVRLGEGMAGRAIRDRSLVIDEQFQSSSYPAAAAGLAGPNPMPMQAASVPLVRDGVVVGALTLLRADTAQRFSETDRDALAMISEQSALAVANAFLHADVHQMAIRDPLTGLFNRRYLDPMMAQMFAQRRRLPENERPQLAAIMFDLDHFSDLNNRYGHQAGDAVLRDFGALLQQRMRSTDLVARIGGEEFAAILFRADLEDAVRIAQQVRSHMAEMRIETPNGEITATVSAGCAVAGVDADTPEALLRAADVALYMAKRAGRDRVVAA